LKILSKIILTFFLLSIPVSGFCISEERFPYHIDRIAEKEMIYPYSFDKVWDAALIVIRDNANKTSEDMRIKHIETFRSDIMCNKGSQLIIYTSSHKDRKGFVEMILPEFTYQALFIYPIDKMKTGVSTNKAVFVLYNGAVLDIEQNARQFYSTQPDESILMKIRDLLKDADNEK
jgi:hypothetical protein